MTGLEATFTALAGVAFLVTAWVVGVVMWRVVKAPKR